MLSFLPQAHACSTDALYLLAQGGIRVWEKGNCAKLLLIVAAKAAKAAPDKAADNKDARPNRPDLRLKAGRAHQ